MPVAADDDVDEVETARQALASLNPNDEVYFSALDNFSISLMSRFALSGNLDDLDEVISRRKEALDLAPPGHYFHLEALCNLGQVLTKRFKIRGDVDDLTLAISYFDAAVASCTPEHSFYLPSVGSLASGLLNRFWRYGDVTDLDRIIETSSTALSARPPQSPNLDVLLNNFATALKERFSKRGNRADLDAALMQYQSCLDLRPPGHPSRHSVLGNLGDAMLLRFEVDGHSQDLESSANCYVEALQLRSPGQDGYLLYLTTLGVIFLRMFYVQGDTERMEMAISCYKAAIEHSTVPNLDHSRLLDNYSSALQARFTLLGNVGDLDQAIQYLTTSSDITPSTYPGRPITLFNLGTVLFNRYNVLGNMADLDSAIEQFASAIELSESGFHQRPIILSVYGRALSARFSAKGDLRDLNLAVSMCKDALTLASPNELNYSSTVANLTSTLLESFYRSGNINECQTVIDYCDRASVSTPQTEPAFIALKVNRAKAFLQKFQHGREEIDINTSITAFREIIPTIPEGHAEYVPVHLQFGIALETRSKLSTDPKDLDESVSLYRIAHRVCKRGDFNYVPVCMQLGNALRERFEYHQDSGDALDEAIVLLAEVEEILFLTPGQSDYKASLINLGVALFVRFQAQRSRADLDTAIERVSRALTLPPSNEDFLVPFTLATFLSVRYHEDANLEDLERCIKLFGVAAEQMPPKHLVRGALCRNYGHALMKLGRHRDRLQQLDTAIVFFKEALEHLPASHYDQPLTYMRLAEALHERAQLRRDSDGLYDAINLLQGPMQTLSQDSPLLHAVCHTAAKLSMSMYELSELQVPSFVEDGFRYYETAARYTYVDSFMSVLAALEWAEHATKRRHASALLAYQTSLDSVNRHLLTTASVKSRHAALSNKHWIKQTSTLATDATACAILRGELALAVELSEQGRGLLWSQLSQSRTPLDALRSASDVGGRALASDFERVSTQLAQSAVAQQEPSTTAPRLTLEEAARRYRRLTKELEDIVLRIRGREESQSFLDRASFESLKHAALGGPVILVNASRQRCDALIVLNNESAPRLVPLPDTTLEGLTTLSAQFYRVLKTTTRVGDEKTREREVVVVLRTLWDTLVHPIVDALSTIVPRGARIWWCPTSKLTSLPLHAAGPYRKGTQNLPNLYVSSYTPTLAALIRARYRPSPPSKATNAFIAIGQATPVFPTASSTTTPALQTTDAELALVRSLLPRSIPFSALSGESSTADAALAALRTHGWAHLACHGHPNLQQPFDAAFALRDRAVTVLDVVRASTGDGDVNKDRNPSHVDVGKEIGDGSPSSPGLSTTAEFAFLSACHTALTDPHADAPDEIVHLAAAMQFSGFRSVIGTMWAVDDGMVGHVVKAFYKSMFDSGDGGGGGGGGGKDGKGPEEQWECTRAARALNKASKLVDKDLVSLDQRIVFIHIGA